MSNNLAKKQSDSAMAIFTTLFLGLILVAIVLLAGCSAATTPDPKESSASVPTTPAVTEETTDVNSTPSFGEVVTYEDGISVSVSKPADYQPSELADGMIEGQPVVIFEFVITNNSEEAFDPTFAMATVESGGSEGSGVFDTSNDVGFPPQTSVLPGQTVKWNQAWSVADPSNITLEIQVGLGRDKSIFSSTN